MKAFKTMLLSLVLCIQFACTNMLFAQCLPMVKIDGNNIITDENHPGGLKLPAWLKSGQTLEKGQYVFSISVIEFTVNGTTLDYSQNLSITTVQTVPAGKVWKIEAVVKDATMSAGVTSLYSTVGTYNFIPSCSGTYKVKVWGGGGGGGGGYSGSCNGNGGGGGAGGYAEGNYFLTSGTTYVVVVGAGGTGGTNQVNGTAGANSSVSVISLTATGGAGGISSTPGNGGVGGNGSGGQLNTSGQSGSAGSSANGVSGKGGDAPNGGGTGGAGVSSGGTGSVGSAPGGGGGGGAYYNSGCGAVGGNGAAGAEGRVEISSGTTGSVTLTPKVPCVTLYLHSSGACTSTNPAPCPAGWTDAGCGLESSASYCRTCYRCD